MAGICNTLCDALRYMCTDNYQDIRYEYFECTGNDPSDPSSWTPTTEQLPQYRPITYKNDRRVDASDFDDALNEANETGYHLFKQRLINSHHVRRGDIEQGIQPLVVNVLNQELTTFKPPLNRISPVLAFSCAITAAVAIPALYAYSCYFLLGEK